MDLPVSVGLAGPPVDQNGNPLDWVMKTGRQNGRSQTVFVFIPLNIFSPGPQCFLERMRRTRNTGHSNSR